MNSGDFVAPTPEITRRRRRSLLIDLLDSFRKGVDMKRKIKTKKKEPVEAKCTQCGSIEFCWPEHAATFVCMDCYACNYPESNDPHQARRDSGVALDAIVGNSGGGE
jgi:hypothetical protein